MSAPSGYTALDFVGFTDKGTYSPIVKYMRNDLVHHGGNIMRCKVDDTMNVTPVAGANWELWVGASANLVERVIAPLENNPADVAFGVGRQIIYDDWLWEVIAPIAIGDALIDYAVDPTNANIKKSAPVETQLLAVKAEADATDNMIAPTEANANSSSAAYSVGDQLILNNILYDVIAAIQIGDALTTGTGGNIAAADTLTDQLNAKANSSDLAAVATSGAYSDLSGKPTLATVATSGSYNDLSNRPTLGTAASKNSTNAVTSSSTALVESGAVYSEVDSVKQALTTTQSSIAPIEDGTNYSKTYYKNEQFFRNGVLYKVTASSVNSSTAINTSSGGNATTADSISEQINDLNTVSEVRPDYRWIGLQVDLRSAGKTHYLKIYGTLTNTLQAGNWYDVANLSDFPANSITDFCTCVEFNNGKAWRVAANTETGKLQINPVETLEYNNPLSLFFTYVC